MKAEYRIKRHILKELLQEHEVKGDWDLNDESVIEELWKKFDDEGRTQDALYEFRCSGVDTGFECEWSRHYDSCAVGRQLSDGTAVGWTYWSGGGKHGEPEAIDWIEESYDLDVREEMRPVKIFTKK